MPFFSLLVWNFVLFFAQILVSKRMEKGRDEVIKIRAKDAALKAGIFTAICVAFNYINGTLEVLLFLGFVCHIWWWVYPRHIKPLLNNR